MLSQLFANNFFFLLTRAFIGKVLPVATATMSKLGARRLDSRGARRQNFNDLSASKVLLLFGDLNKEFVTGSGECYKKNKAFVSGDSIPTEGHFLNLNFKFFQKIQTYKLQISSLSNKIANSRVAETILSDP